MESLSVEEFLSSAREFIKVSERINDDWKLCENEVELHKSYLKKNTFITESEPDKILLKAEYVIFYNQSYNVPSFSFNVWNSSGSLLTLEEIREMSVVRINTQEFYSVITQQEHPIFFKPYFIMHPCHTERLISDFKQNSNNIIVTFLGLITPLIKLNLPLQYGL